MDPQPAFHSDEDALAAYVAQLIRTTATLMGIVEHMTRSLASGRSAPGAPPVEEVLSRLLRDALGGPLAREHPRSAIERTSAILADTAEIVGSELLLVPLDGPYMRPRRPSRAQRRARRPG
ncbi:MAG: hypothetical protein QOK16_804 [Solirubrobacteraceae bacterium]|jgi:hypothetical protein|nr:hypothetical protein [Solirubrobacteraceae bacterium]